ncbi:glycoside hydrolase/phage tail family protein [Rickettsia endosymbiont of Cardiosporidium cionae]|uniref:glycoside hydrolase/phage tail family protein n=1 Tax=Rickettsia endosymbiont of Cardiosporidium cionae TaxID=2777155 RepID=UPI001895F5EE|nr:glycoside hydrolase TIM-barrel-like domain-containing protein [Rickettsia endosymbiont of Cardiosporidium cionae]KAF8818421.1 hypothetical protein IHI24_000511 [Rickettsia endosymbiont of Cardiosporidium cionae]
MFNFNFFSLLKITNFITTKFGKNKGTNLPILGNFISSIGSKIASSCGMGIVSTIFSYSSKIFNQLFTTSHKPYDNIKPITLKDPKSFFKIYVANYGSPIPLIFGKTICHGKIIWSTDIKYQHKSYQVQNLFNIATHGNSKNSKDDFEYYISFAIAICEGEILEINRIFYNNKDIDISTYNFRIYHGSETQLPDPTIAANNRGVAPAFRDLAYIVFKDLPLSDFNNSIPYFTFEVTRQAKIQNTNYNLLEDMITSMVMIPGSGEYVYDTKIQSKFLKNEYNFIYQQQQINANNIYNISDSVHSLNQLQSTCKNLEWISVVVCWFADDLDIKNCTIRPAVEYIEQDGTEYTEEWYVSKYNRKNAFQIGRDKINRPRYGGTVNDKSVIRYIKTLKDRGLSVMFYPLILLDTEQKPWRGKISGNANDIKKFFHNPQGYNEFILHYANLVKDYVDVFVIGSEMVGITKIRDNDNSFPAVQELVKLTEIVKKIVGHKVLITYAADWSEYHHTTQGWYHLDQLWSSPNIDFIGIDAYFPVTNSKESEIEQNLIDIGWETGEGYDYYVDDSGNKHRLSPEYAWKNIEYWWNHHHVNPDGNKTSWQPKSKKIWFTEFGFPSIDKSSNRPNVFFDPTCAEGGVPDYSNGNTDFSIQRRAIKSFITYWSSKYYVEKMFLWCWDARPYPAWPHLNIWADGYLWEKGHWVNNKLGHTTVAAIIADISQRAGIAEKSLKLEHIDQKIEGITFDRKITYIEAINNLRIGYFFDIVSNDSDYIVYITRSKAKAQYINTKDMIKISDTSLISISEIPTSSIINKIDLYYQNNTDNYQYKYLHTNSERNISYRNVMTLTIPIAMSESSAINLSNMILQNALGETHILSFILPISYAYLKPSDIIKFDYLNKTYQVRVINIRISGLFLSITSIVDKMNYNLISNRETNDYNRVKDTYIIKIDTKFIVLDLPFNLTDLKEPYIAVYLQSDEDQYMYFKFPYESEESWHNITQLSSAGCIGQLAKIQQKENFCNRFLIDEQTEITVKIEQLDISKLKDEWHIAMLGLEFIRFKKISKISNNIYRITELVRGEFATEQYINTHKPYEQFIILSFGYNILPVSEKMIQQNVMFKAGKQIITNFSFHNNAQKIIAPYITKSYILSTTLNIEWIARRALIDDWENNYIDNTTNIEYVIELSDTHQSYQFTTQNNEISIDLSEIDISDQYNWNIIARKIIN